MAAVFDAPIVCPVLIGRERHVAAIAGALDAAAKGRGGTLLIAGEAGIGKSRLLAEGRALAISLGFETLTGRTFETARALPYATFVDLLRIFFADRPAQPVAEVVGPAAPELLALMPELGSRLPGVAPAIGSDPEGDKRRLFHAIAEFLRRRSAAAPLLIALEDIHWADGASLELLAHLARRLADAPVLLLATYRSDETDVTLRHALTELDRGRLAAELRLPPLTVPEVDQMLRATLGRPGSVRADALHLLYGRTEGNPFFIEEVLRTVAAGHGADPLAQLMTGETRVPRSVEDAVQRRLVALDDATRAVLRIAAVAGQRWDFALMVELTGLDEDELLGHVKALIGAGIVVEESADRFAFRHALTREAVRAELLARERRVLHGRIAAALEWRHAAMIDSFLADLCYHFSEAEDWERALAYGRRAGERAVALHAPHAALEHFGRALDAAARLGDAPAALLRARGAARETLGDFDGAREDYERALDRARSGGALRQEWEALYALGCLWPARDYARAGAYWGEALDLARRLDDPPLLARALNRVGNWHMNAEHPSEAQRHHREALAILRDLDDRPGIAETLDLLGMALMLGCDLDNSAQCYDEAIAHFRALDDRRGLAASLLGRGMHAASAQTYTLALPPGGTVSRSLALSDEALALARSIEWRAGESFAMVGCAEHIAGAADYARAFAAARDALAIAREIDHRQWQTFAHALLGRIQLDLFAIEAARSDLECALALAQETGSLHWERTAAGWLASALIAQGDQARVALLLDTALGDAPPTTIASRIAWSARLELALARGEPERALAIADLMTDSAPNASDRPLLGTALARSEALIAVGRLAAAEAALLPARTLAEEQGARALLWRFDAALATLARRAGRADDAARHAAAARAAIDAVAAALPDTSLRDGFLAGALARLPGGRLNVATRQNPGGLTAREREITALIGHGLSNRAIAETLILGERTVETHVSNILAKLDFTSRSQVAAWAAREGIGG